VECFKKIYGAFKYTAETRNAWAKWMNGFMWNKRGKRFDALTYDPDFKDLVKEESQATKSQLHFSIEYSREMKWEY
jgi:hypothetical protein